MQNLVKILGRSKRFAAIFCALFFLVASPSCLSACTPAWSAGFSTALELAKRSGNPILMIFLGSDWDEKSIQLHQDILPSQQFGDYAKQNFVLLKIDFPQQQLESTEVRAANEQLAARYKIQSLPMCIVIDGSGKELGRTVYTGGSLADFVVALNDIKTKSQGLR